MFHICFAANESYIKYTAVLITSIIKSTDTSKKFKDFFETNTHTQNANRASLASYKKRDYSSLSKDEQSEGFIFHILSDFVSENSRAKLANLAKTLSEIYPCEIQIHICDDDIFQGLPKLGGNYLTYFKLFLPNFMPENTKLCLYLDVDMLVLKDLRELFALDLESKILGVVKEWMLMLHYVHQSRGTKFCIKGGRFEKFYFNAGLLLINLTQWRKQDITKQCFDFFINYKDKIVQHEQDALNFVVSYDKALVLPFEFNVFIDRIKENNDFLPDYSDDEIKYALQHITICHFKAWCLNDNDVGAWTDRMKWWQVAFQTPFFKDELKRLFTTKKENYFICKEFGLYIASLINEHSKSFLGYLKIPFVVWRAFKEFDLRKNDDYVVNADTNLDKNLAFEFLYVATKAWGQRKQSERIFQFIALPYKIYRAKCRCQKGNFRAQKKSVYHKLYIT